MAGTDFSHLTTEELIKGIKALKLPDYIRSKAYGIDVRETLAQMTEMLMQLAYNQGMDPQQAKDWVSQLNNKINKGEVSIFDIDKTKGKFDQTYMSDTFLQQMAGTTPINSVPADGSLVPKQFAFPVVEGVASKNLFNKETAIPNKYINGSGGLSDAKDWYASDYIPIKPNTNYYKSSTNSCAFYDETKKFIEFTSQSYSVLSPSSARYMRISIPPTLIYYDLDNFMVNEGTTEIEYTPYGAKIDVSKIVGLNNSNLSANVIIVSKNGGGDFTTITDAVNSITDSSPTKRYTIMIMAGTYEEQVSIQTKYIDLVGLNLGSVTLVSKSGQYDLPPLEMSSLNNIKNLIIISTEDKKPIGYTGEPAYAVHHDYIGEGENHIDNCILDSYSNCPIGIGTHQSQNINIKNTKLISRVSSRPPLLYHPKVGTATNQKLILDNCRLQAEGYSVMSIIDSNNFGGNKDNRDTVLSFYNNVMWSKENGKTDVLYTPNTPLITGALDGHIMLSDDSFGNNVLELNGH